MNTSQFCKETSVPRQKLYYLEQKGFVTPRKIRIGELEYREFARHDVEKVRRIWGYVKEGFRYRVAYEKAMDDLTSREE